jgi:predicted nucleotidyltransferase
VEQTDLLKHAIQELQRLGISHAIVGSFASGAWGESRFTQDIDIVVDLDSQQAAELCKAFPSEEFYVSESAALEAVQHQTQFNVIHPSSGNKIDFMIAGDTPWAVAQLQRSRRVRLFPDVDAQFAAPEDVILGKLIYYREGGSEKHLRDIAGILKISPDDVDREYVSRFATQLGVADLWQQVLQRVEK